MCNRYFFTSAGMGFEAYLSKRYNADAWSSKLRGVAPYFPMALMEFFRYRCEPVLIQAEGFSERVCPFILTAANIERLGGDAVIAPGASPDDGFLDLCIVPRIGFFKSLSLASKLFSKNIDTFKGYTRIRTSWAEITGDGTSSVHVDGEPFDWSGPVTIGVLPKSLRILV
jgi:diacylglycerol kinase family enzyme